MVVIGSGIGGLSCAGLLAKYGLKVVVCESHDVPGGAAHTWTVRAPGGEGLYHFESGPSLYSGGLRQRQARSSNAPSGGDTH